MADPQPDLIVIGAVAGAHGVKGEARLKSFTNRPEDLFAYGPFLDEAGSRRLTPTRWRAVKGGFVAAFEEPVTREALEALKGARLYAPRSALPETDADEFYHADLIGLAVEDALGAPLGRVRAVFDFSAGDLLEIAETPGRTGSWLITFTQEACPLVDIAGGRIVVIEPSADDGGDP